ncbi:MAG: ABC transporter substrate-binding protein [Candidatus Paceibacteria bacterium]
MFQKFIDFVKEKFASLKGEKTKSTRINQQLLKKIRGKKFPSWQQIKHIKSVFSPKEKQLFNLSILLLLVGLLWGSVVWTADYRKTVPAVGGEYVEGVVGSPQLINPLFSSLNNVDKDIAKLVYSGLVRYDKNQNLVLDLAENYKVSEDGTVYTFELKKGVKWHDGETLTAEDVVFTYRKIKDKSINSPRYVTFKNVEVEKTGEYKVQFKLDQPYAFFLHDLTVGILPKHVWSDISSKRMRLTQKNLQPIGTGPFQFKNLAKDNSGYIYKYSLKRNKDFYRQPPHIQTLTFQFFRSYGGNNGSIQALQEQSIDGLRFVPSNKRDKVDKKHINSYKLDPPQYTALFFNNDSEFLENKAVRTAASLAIDKDRILQEALDGRGEIIGGPVLPGFTGYTEVTSSEHNIKKANELLKSNFSRIDKKEYKSLRKMDLIEERGLEGSASSSTLESFYRETDPQIEEQYTGDGTDYEKGVQVENRTASTSDRNVTLTLQGTSTDKVIISNDTDFENNKARDFKKNMDWKLTPGNGEKWVFVKFLSDEGEGVVYDTINLQDQYLSEKTYMEEEIEPNKEKINGVRETIDQELDSPQTFYRKSEDGEILDFEITTLRSKEYKQSAKVIKSFMAELGIRVDLRFVGSSEMSQRIIKNRTYDALLYGVVIGGNGDQFPFWHSSQTKHPGLNLSMYENEKVDKLLSEARQATSTQKIAKNYQEFQQIIREDKPAVFLYRPIYTYAQSTRVKGFDLSGIYSLEDRFSNVTEWYLETESEWHFPGI